MSKLWLIPVLLLLLVVPSSAIILIQIHPTTCDWYDTGTGSELLALSGCFDNSIGTACSWSNYATIRIKCTFPPNRNVSQIDVHGYSDLSNYNLYSSYNNIGEGNGFANTLAIQANVWSNYSGVSSGHYYNSTANPIWYFGKYGTQHLAFNELEFWGNSTDNPSLLPLANFTATPLSGPASLYVLFNDASTNLTGTETYNWSITPTEGVTGYTGTSKDHSASFAIPGNYTISHGISNILGSTIETKINYITVYNATTDYITTAFAAMDQPRWVQLAGSTINLLDVENGTWKNASPSAHGYEEIVTKTGHHISAYASMTGYGDADLLSQPAWNGGVYQILMFPNGYNNVTAGNVTLYVNVWDYATSQRLPGATVNMAYNIAGAQYNDYRITPASGVATFIVPNKTTIYLYGEKAGYKQAGTTVYSGTGSGGSASVTGDITLIQEYVTTAPTTTAIPTGIPTVCDSTGCHVITIDPNPCIGDGSDSDNANCQRKQTEMASQLIAWGPQLELLFIIATVIGVFKIMTK
jgi:PKD repeat protein